MGSEDNGSLKLGLLGRAEPRGLGVQSLEVARHLLPERVLLVEPQPPAWPLNLAWYDGFDVTRVQWHRGQLDERIVRPWLESLSGGVVYAAETFYSDEFPAWCAAAGVIPVRHVNPEQLAQDEVADDGTCWWAATPWRLEHLPPGTRVVPMPVAIDRFAPHVGVDGPLRFLHSVGHFAQEDRSGSSILSQTLRRLRADCRVTVRCQDRGLHIPFKHAGRGVEVTVNVGGLGDYWEQYQDQDVLVLPRRYGGLSLPSQEALAAGLVLVMSDCEPNQLWPGPKVRVRRRWSVRMRPGMVELCDACPVDLGEVMSRLCGDRGEVAHWQAESRAWAERNSWEALRPLWLEELERACLAGATTA